MRRRTRRRRRRPSSTSSARLARRSWTSTSPLPTRVGVVVVAIVDVVDEAVVKDAVAEVVDVVMAKDVHPTGNDNPSYGLAL